MFDFLKATFHPAPITALLVFSAVGVLLLYVKSASRWGRRCLTAVVAVYWMLSCPAGVALLTRTVTGGYGPIHVAAEAHGATAIVLLGAGSSNLRAGGRQLPVVTHGSGLRALETARLYRLLSDPLVVLSGGTTEQDSAAAPESAALRAALLALGVPPARIVLESESKNTHDEAVALKRMLRDLHVDQFVLVTSPLHMARAMATFAAEGLHPVPSTAPLSPDREMAPFALLPNGASLEIGDSVVYEWLARAYYWWRGWLSEPVPPR